MTVIPVPGSYAVDERDGRIGLGIGHAGPCVQLRPPGGGVRWRAVELPAAGAGGRPAVRRAAARVRELNRQSRMP